MTSNTEVPTETPRLIRGGIAFDDRGAVRVVNDFDLSVARRFYTVSNHRAGFVRAWHAHRHEAKYVTVLVGAALVGAVAVDDWENPSREASVHRQVLCAAQPAILYVPPGYANGIMSLTDDALVQVFSNKSLHESLQDDVRFPARHWDIWTVEER